MKIIDSNQSYIDFLDDFLTDSSIIIPILSDHRKHVLNNKLSLLYVYVLGGHEYVIPVNHYESLFDITVAQLKTDLDNGLKKYVYDKKIVKHLFNWDFIIDTNLIHHFKYNSPLDSSKLFTSAHEFYNGKYWKYGNINDFIPITKHIEYCTQLKNALISLIDFDDKSFQLYNNSIDNYVKIESAGMNVTNNKFNSTFGPTAKIHIDSNKTYTEYNMFTSTGRPSNRHGGINYSALNKDDGTRSCFTSRFENGAMIEYDFDAYHLRLIAQLIDYELPKSSVHRYMAKMYFDKNDISEDEYKKAKEISFRILYGGVPKEYEHIKFFSEVKNFINSLWKHFNFNGYIETPVFMKKLYKKNYEDMNRNKLFNYYIQAMETEANSIMIEKILNVTKKYNSELILTTYDSMLFDFDITDGKSFLDEIANCFDYPVKVQYGFDYDSMSDVTQKVLS
tara:strand:+ start:1868 stop:3214 length:1347 start_codon:yes stop_codon:yes gene_type:complete